MIYRNLKKGYKPFEDSALFFSLVKGEDTIRDTFFVKREVHLSESGISFDIHEDRLYIC